MILFYTRLEEEISPLLVPSKNLTASEILRSTAHDIQDPRIKVVFLLFVFQNWIQHRAGSLISHKQNRTVAPRFSRPVKQ
ncbi:hypothetical protein AV530_006022 [Patagioenas fasciata monilis]|uniref:Uncharacterized protein n=1 Tax=Patagioenas fasciata monilis TaxID=372326 RepID=A0A1V4J8E4_PATFA|nr:hypothetical protein AV530_006022 [Patagioenas fasciata monilis]